MIPYTWYTLRMIDAAFDTDRTVRAADFWRLVRAAAVLPRSSIND